MRRIAAALRLIAALAILGGPCPAVAHHSFAMYDQTRTVTLKGTIKTFMWTNPHVIIWVLGAPITGGAPEIWSVELTSPGNLTRMGWNRTSLKPGDEVEMQILPLRDGQSGGAFTSAKLLATGQVLTAHWVKPAE